MVDAKKPKASSSSPAKKTKNPSPEKAKPKAASPKKEKAEKLAEVVPPKVLSVMPKRPIHGFMQFANKSYSTSSGKLVE